MMRVRLPADWPFVCTALVVLLALVATDAHAASSPAVPTLTDLQVGMLVVWLFSGVLARAKGRSVIGVMLAGVFLTPLLPLLYVMIMPNAKLAKIAAPATVPATATADPEPAPAQHISGRELLLLTVGLIAGTAALVALSEAGLLQQLQDYVNALAVTP